MGIVIKKTDRRDITKIVCPDCGTRVKGVGLLKGSRIDGLSIACHRCSAVWVITTE